MPATIETQINITQSTTIPVTIELIDIIKGIGIDLTNSVVSFSAAFYKYKRDANGNLMYETIPIQQVDAGGNPVFDENGHPVMVTQTTTRKLVEKIMEKDYKISAGEYELLFYQQVEGILGRIIEEKLIDVIKTREGITSPVTMITGDEFRTI